MLVMEQNKTKAMMGTLVGYVPALESLYVFVYESSMKEEVDKSSPKRVQTHFTIGFIVYKKRSFLA